MINDVRTQILEIIVQNPGIHFRKLQDLAGHEVGVIDYHTRVLEQSNYIFSISHKGYRLFFHHQWETNRGKMLKLIGYLRKSTPRKLVIYLLLRESQNQSLKQIADDIGIAQSTLNWHVKRMVEDEIVRPIRHGRIVSLVLTIDHDIVRNIGNEIYPSRWEKFLDYINDSFPV